VLLEDLDLVVRVSDEAARIAGTLAQIAFPEGPWREAFRARFAIVSDDVFTFLAETATEVAARVRLDAESKTAAGQALWYEEAVPAEALFSAPILAARRSGTAAGPFSLLQPLQSIQLGGHTTTGRGLVRLILSGGAA
jgi:CRISPR-associated protein Cmr4